MRGGDQGVTYSSHEGLWIRSRVMEIRVRGKRRISEEMESVLKRGGKTKRDRAMIEKRTKNHLCRWSNMRDMRLSKPPLAPRKLLYVWNARDNSEVTFCSIIASPNRNTMSKSDHNDIHLSSLVTINYCSYSKVQDFPTKTSLPRLEESYTPSYMPQVQFEFRVHVRV